MKEIKDLPRNVRVNSQKLSELEAKGWSTQKIIDWAMKRLKGKEYKPESKK